MLECSIDGCDKKVKAKGYCTQHYYRFNKYGDPLATAITREVKTRKSPLPYNESHKMIDNIEHKLCRKCEKWFPMNSDYFYKKNTKDGFDSYCKECVIKASTKRIYDNIEESLEYKRQHYRRNREKMLRQSTIANNNNIERRKETSRNWRRNNKDKVNTYSLIRRMNKSHNISTTEKQKCKEYFGYKCAYCDSTEEENRKIYNQQLHMDHVDPNGANDLSNNVPACLSCNVKKRDRPVDEFYMKYDIPPENINKVNKWLNGDYLKCIDKKINI